MKSSIKFSLLTGDSLTKGKTADIWVTAAGGKEGAGELSREVFTEEWCGAEP